MSLETVRVGFIGAGVMAQWQIYPSLYFAPLELVALCDQDAARAKSVADKYGTRWYTNYEQMFASEELEAVIIHMHPKPRQQLVLAALGAGYHVLVPKPPALNLAATRELAAAAEHAGRVLMVNFQSRFSFGIRQAKAVMSRPEFGPLSQVFCSFCSGAYDGNRGRDYEGPVHAFVLDFTTHHLDLVRYLAGEVERLSLFHCQNEGRVALALALDFENGAVGTMQMNSQRVWGRNYDRIELTGQGEYLVVDSLWRVKHYTKSQNSFTENYRDQRSIELTGDAYALLEFSEAIREGRQPLSNIHESVRTMRLYQAIWGAVDAGRQGDISLHSLTA